MTDPVRDIADPVRYAACEVQRVDGGSTRRYVRLHDEPMHMRDVLAWLVDGGFVKRTKIWDPDDGETYAHHGWGTTYFAVPWERSVAR